MNAEEKVLERPRMFSVQDESSYESWSVFDADEADAYMDALEARIRDLERERELERRPINPLLVGATPIATIIYSPKDGKVTVERVPPPPAEKGSGGGE